MINILLVDDDVLVLTKIKQLILFLKSDYQVVKDVTSAKEALEFSRNNEVDILITDMKMPKMDGIDLIKEVKKLNINIQIIAISSYEDFYYVKESLKEGSIDYILKYSLNEETLKSALDNAKRRILTNKSLQVTKLERDKLIKSSKVLLKKEFLTELLQGEVSKDNIIKNFKDYDLNIDYGNLIIIICEIDNYRVITEDFDDKDKKIFKDAAFDIISKVLEKTQRKEIIYLRNGEYVIFMSSDQKSNLYTINGASQYAERISDNLERLLNIEVSISISNCCNNLTDISKVYSNAKNKLKKKFFEGKGKVYNAFERSTGVQVIKNNFDFNKREIIDKLKKGDDSLLNDINLLFNKYKEERYPFEIIELTAIEMLNVGNDVIKDYKINIDTGKYNMNVLYRNIYKYETIEDINELIVSFYVTILSNVNKINKLLDASYSKYTVKCINYIEKNYSKQASLQEAADFIGVNAAYLSKIFKEDVGENFVEYLNKHRIKSAQELIKSKKYSIKEICVMVGFANYNYFFKVFRQVTNLTPSEFQKNIKIL
ncbi:two-component system, response regulator YesN [Clostridium amylolyticum]|uniref:Stage 0 sporulation protein A homolog n=1 Tax=Clostridium amylolyticum TaxID=1121298 RepID=A0A1M6GQ67_9CLOT|nr:response regulator [Clostridium amylolyticum]SHJ12032.1 two-component system, response regulator YesN [Clostridium amylolyticum]